MIGRYQDLLKTRKIILSQWTKFTSRSLAVAVMVVMAGALSHVAQADLKKGPHGGLVVQNENDQFEVKVDPQGKTVSVYALGQHPKLPETLDLTLFQDYDSGQTIKLNALSLQNSDAQYRGPQYQGNLAPNMGSYIGIGIHFETSLKAFKTLKYMPDSQKKQKP